MANRGGAACLRRIVVYACKRAEPHVEHEGVNNQSRRQAMEKSSTAVIGMDVHKESIDVAIAGEKEARHYGRIWAAP